MVSRVEAIGVLVLLGVVVVGTILVLSFPLEDGYWILPVVVLFAVVLAVFALRTVGFVASDN
jgi:uncharacterized membrane protein